MSLSLRIWFLFGVSLFSVSVSRAESLLIRGATLIDGTGTAPIRNSSILIESDQIVAAGPSPLSNQSLLSDVRIVEAGGKFIVPGYIDSHVHYRGYMGELFLAHGVTTVYDLGNPFYWQSALKKGFNEGRLRGPRFYFCSGFSNSSSASSGQPSIYSRSPVSIDTPSQARRAVQDLKDEGADCLKLNENYSAELFSAIAKEARTLGLAVISHSLNAAESAGWGITGIEHMVGIALATISRPEGRAAVEQMTIEAGHKNSALYNWMEPSRFDGLIQTLIAQDVFINPTLAFEWKALSPRANQQELEDTRLFNIPELSYAPLNERLVSLGQYHWADSISAEEKALFRAGYAKVQEFLKKFVRAGGKIYAGTDTAAATTPGLSLHHELELLVDAGLTPLEALQTVTSYAAEILHLEDRIGTVTPGRWADLVILNSDPLADIRNARDVSSVIQNGQEVDVSYHSSYSIPFGRPGPESKHLYNPPPRLVNISPPMVRERDSSSLTITGQGFVSESVVEFGDLQLETTWHGPNRLEAVLPSSLTSRVGTFWVRVQTPQPGGGPSNRLEFIVTYR